MLIVATLYIYIEYLPRGVCGGKASMFALGSAGVRAVYCFHFSEVMTTQLGQSAFFYSLLDCPEKPSFVGLHHHGGEEHPVCAFGLLVVVNSNQWSLFPKSIAITC